MDKIISQIAERVKQQFLNEGSGHDWWHIYRVWQTAKTIAEKDNLNSTVVEIAALLHDIADWKENNLDSSLGGKRVHEILSSYKVSDEDVKHIASIVENISFKGISDKDSKLTTEEGKAVWDADKLDAIGAIGIIRCFTFGGKKGIPIHEPNSNADAREFGKRLSNTSIDHFYEKLLLLKDMMYTKTGKELAVERHNYMLTFLDRFYKEWEGKS